MNDEYLVLYRDYYWECDSYDTLETARAAAIKRAKDAFSKDVMLLKVIEEFSSSAGAPRE